MDAPGDCSPSRNVGVENDQLVSHLRFSLNDHQIIQKKARCGGDAGLCETEACAGYCIGPSAIVLVLSASVFNGQNVPQEAGNAPTQGLAMLS